MSVSTGNDKAVELKMGSAQVKETENLKEMFADLAAQAYKDFKRPSLVVDPAADIPSVAVWLNEKLRGAQDEPLAIEVDVKNYDELFRALQQRWSFTRPTFLQQLTKIIKNEALSQKMKEYIEKYNSFCSSLKLNKTASLEDYDSSKPCLILIFESGTTFEDVEVFLRDVFSIYTRYLRVHKIEPGSVKVILQFPASMEPLLQACIDQKRAASKHYKLKTMRIQASPTEQDAVEDAVCKKATRNVSLICQNKIIIMTFFIAVAFISAYVLK